MNTQPDAITVLCYGDSNTWGQKPDKTGRYPADIRWPGKLQEILGSNYYIIEEGLSSRTTDLDYVKPGRNGKTYLTPCLASHNPLDIVVLMLGSNDLKIEFNRDALAVAKSIEGLIQDIRNTAKDKNGTTPLIIVISPILIEDTAPRFSEFYTGYYDHESAVKSQNLATEIAKIASQNDCTFLDASTVAYAGEDGLHFNLESHPALATLVADAIR